jgi:hypothetical protein
VTHKEKTVQSEILTDSDRLLMLAIDLVAQNQATVQCVLLTDCRLSVEDSIVHSETEPRDGIV